MTNDIFQEKIADLKKNNIYRSLSICDTQDQNHVIKNGKEYISFCSNDYLGLSQNKEVKKAVINAVNKYGFGSGASRYVTGNNSLYSLLERKLSQLKNSEDSIVFGSGYLAGVSCVSALVGKDDLIIADKLIHSCLINGSKLSGAKMLRFRHNDIKHAEEILSKHRSKYKKCLIISETVFSMDGDLGKIEDLLDLSLKFDCLTICDDAHAIGIIKNSYDKKYQDIHLQMGTLSKAVGGYGGYICGSNILIDYLRNFAQSAIYSTALPPSTIAGNIKSLEIIAQDKTLGKKSLDNARYFTKLLNLKPAHSSIVIIIIGDSKKTVEASNKISDEGYLVSAIRPPTVQKGKSRLRITFNANHRMSDIKKLAFIVKKELV